MVIGLLFGLFSLWALCDSVFLHRARWNADDPVAIILLSLLFGILALLLIPNCIKMMIKPRVYMVADATGITLHAYKTSRTIDKDTNGRIRMTTEKNPTTTFGWDQVLSFSEDRSSLGRLSMPGKPAAVSKCLRITISPSVDLDGFTCKGLIGADSALDADALSRSEYSRLTAEELKQYECAECCIAARFLPGGIDHAIDVLQEMKEKYTRV